MFDISRYKLPQRMGVSRSNLHQWVNGKSKRVVQLAIACSIGLLWVWTGLIDPAAASLLSTADTSGAIVVQSRRTLRDQNHQSWQVIAFKRIQPMAEEPQSQRLIGFPDSVEVAHPQPILLLNVQGQAWTAADVSDQIPTAQPSLGQYQLQSVLSELPLQPLRLEMPLTDGKTILLRVPPALIQEWRAIALTRPSQLMNACDQFPLEARQNPAFPDWTGCRITTH